MERVNSNQRSTRRYLRNNHKIPSSSLVHAQQKQKVKH